MTLYNQIKELRYLKNNKISVKEVLEIVQLDDPNVKKSDIEKIFNDQDSIIKEDFETESLRHEYSLNKYY